MFNRLVAGLLVLAGVSCYPKPDIKIVYAPEQYVVQNSKVYVDITLSRSNVTRLLKIVDYVLTQWNCDFGKQSMPFSLYILNVQSFLYNGEALSGLHVGHVIYVSARSTMDIEAFYHELCHHNIVSIVGKADANHEDPLWRWWDKRCDDMVRDTKYFK